MNNRPLTVYLVAGEASGDFLGAHLMQALKARAPNVKFFGIGGPRMQEQGLKSLFPYHELSLMGIVELFPYLLKLAARINLTVEDVLAKSPDVVVTIDVPGFSLRVVEKLRKEKSSAKFVHYVAPTVWAYNAYRADTCARLFDHLLVLLPFEPPYFEPLGLGCTFVGHPVVTETSVGDAAAFRKTYEVSEQTKLFCLLPGSRKGEIKRHIPIFARAIAILSTHYPDLAIAVAVPKNMLPFVTPYFRTCPFRAVITANEDDKKNAIAASQVVLAKSGTVALEVAMAGTPMIVSHRLHALSAWVFRRKAMIRWVNLVNILQKKEIIPELLQELCTPVLLANAMFQLLDDPARQQQQKTECESALKKLLPAENEMPSNLAANCILKLLKR